METTYTSKTTCKFCGRTLTVTTTSDDGYDWCGHHRGYCSSDTYTEKCSCEFGRLENSLPHVKKMCMNCKHYQDGDCTNKKEIDEIKNLTGNFDLKVTKLAVKKPNLNCKYHELDYRIFEELIDKESKEVK